MAMRARYYDSIFTISLILVSKLCVKNGTTAWQTIVVGRASMLSAQSAWLCRIPQPEETSNSRADEGRECFQIGGHLIGEDGLTTEV